MRPDRTKLVSIALLGLLTTSRCAPASHLSFTELRENYSPRFYATEHRVILVVKNLPGLNLVALEAVTKDGRVILEGHRISSGGAGIRAVCAELPSYDLRANWPEHLWWANPDGQLVYVTPVITGSEAHRLGSACT
jgi:hypothetical protein